MTISRSHCAETDPTRRGLVLGTAQAARIRDNIAAYAGSSKRSGSTPMTCARTANRPWPRSRGGPPPAHRTGGRRGGRRRTGVGDRDGQHPHRDPGDRRRHRAEGECSTALYVGGPGAPYTIQTWDRHDETAAAKTQTAYRPSADRTSGPSRRRESWPRSRQPPGSRRDGRTPAARRLPGRSLRHLSPAREGPDGTPPHPRGHRRHGPRTAVLRGSDLGRHPGCLNGPWRAAGRNGRPRGRVVRVRGHRRFGHPCHRAPSRPARARASGTRRFPCRHAVSGASETHAFEKAGRSLSFTTRPIDLPGGQVDLG